MILAGTQSGVSGGSQTKCDTVTYNPESGDAPITVTISTTTTGAHIFYTISNQGVTLTPTHNGDNPTGATFRIGNSSGSVSIGPIAGVSCKQINALAYKLGLLDSDVTISGLYCGTGGGG
jgi:hypothetical protein